MPYIGNITQDFNVNNAMLDTDSVTSIKIVDGTIEGADIAANLDLSDTQKIRLGAGNDLQIYHNGTDSIIDSGTGNLKIIAPNDVTAIQVFNDGTVNIGSDTDNVKLRFGIGSDLQIYHDGSHSYIDDSSNELRVKSALLRLRASNDDAYITCVEDGSVNLYYDNSKKFETTSGGVAITGGITTTTNSTFDGNYQTFTGANYNAFWDKAGNYFKFVDNAKAVFGSTQDLQIYHDGSHSFINQTGTGHLIINSSATNNVDIMKAGHSEYMARFKPDNAVELYYDNTKRFETTTTGVKTLGDLSIRNSSNTQHIIYDESDGALEFVDNIKATFGAGNDLQIYHNGSNSYIDNTTGNLYFRGSNGQMLFRPNNSEDALILKPNGSVELYYDNVKKFETTSGGAKITGILSSSITSGQAITLADNAQIHIGTSDDLRLYHDGNSRIVNTNGGVNLVLQSDYMTFRANHANEDYIKCVKDGQVELYYNNSLRLSTTASGVTLGHNLFLDNATNAGRDVTWDPANDQLQWKDNTKASFGASSDLQIYHDGSDSLIKDAGTGLLGILTNGLRVNNAANNESMIKADENGAVELHHDNVLRITTETTGARVNVAGNSGLRIDGTTADVDPRIVFRRHSNDGNNSEPAAIQMTYFAGSTHESGHLDFFTNGDSGSAGLTKKFRIQNDGVKYLDNTFNTAQNNARKSYFNNTGQQFHGRNAHESYIVFQDVSGTTVGSITRGTNNVAYNTSSDYRLKENVVTLSDAITRLKTLSPKRFNFISEPSITMDGFLAHEVTAVPEAIEGEKDGIITQAMLDADTLEGTVGDPIYQGIDQSKLVPLLTAALQEAIAKVETLETKVAALEAA